MCGVSCPFPWPWCGTSEFRSELLLRGLPSSPIIYQLVEFVARGRWSNPALRTSPVHVRKTSSPGNVRANCGTYPELVGVSRLPVPKEGKCQKNERAMSCRILALWP